MSTISAGSSQRPSPRDALQNQLASAIKSGSVKSADQDTLSAALDSIDQSLKSKGDASRASGGKRPSPDDLKATVNDLIDQQVQGGKLTEDQASELKDVFKKTFEQGGPGKAGGPPPPPPADEDGNATTETGSSSSSDALTKLMDEFLKSIKERLSSSYDAAGTKAKTSTKTDTSLFVDVTA